MLSDKITRDEGQRQRVIQEVLGRNDLGTLQRYLEVSPEQKRRVVAVIGF